MQKICTKCNYVGDAIKNTGYGKAVIVFSIVMLIVFTWLGFWHPIFALGSYFFLLLLVSSIHEELIPSIECLSCNKRTLIPVKSHEAQNIILANEISIDDYPFSNVDLISGYESLPYRKRQICSNCYRVQSSGSGSYMTWGLGFIVVGIVSIPLAYFSPLYLIINFLLLSFGILSTLFCFMEPDRCDKCKKRTLISINSSEGRKIIKEQDLNISEPILDEYTESKLYRFHENIGGLIMIILLLILAFTIFKLYGYFSSF